MAPDDRDIFASNFKSGLAQAAGFSVYAGGIAAIGTLLWGLATMSFWAIPAAGGAFIVFWLASELVLSSSHRERAVGWVRRTLGATSVEHRDHSAAIPTGLGTPVISALDASRRHYSTADKDRIADALADLSEILRGQAEPLVDYVGGMIRDWETGRANDLSDEITQALTMAEVADGLAAGVKSSIVSLRYKYSVERYRSLLDEVIDCPTPREPGPVHDMQMALRDFKNCLSEAREIHAAAPNQKGPIYTLMNEMIRRLAHQRGYVQSWINACDHKIASLEQEILR